MIKYILKKNNVEGSHSFGKWYAFPVKESTVDIDKLAEHMAAHNTPYSAGAIKGIITDMVSCIKELLLEGRSVKLPDLAISLMAERIETLVSGAKPDASLVPGGRRILLSLLLCWAGPTGRTPTLAVSIGMASHFLSYSCTSMFRLRAIDLTGSKDRR